MLKQKNDESFKCHGRFETHFWQFKKYITSIVSLFSEKTFANIRETLKAENPYALEREKKKNNKKYIATSAINFVETDVAVCKNELRIAKHGPIDYSVGLEVCSQPGWSHQVTEGGGEFSNWEQDEMLEFLDLPRREIWNSHVS